MNFILIIELIIFLICKLKLFCMSFFGLVFYNQYYFFKSLLGFLKSYKFLLKLFLNNFISFFFYISKFQLYKINLISTW